MPDDAVRSPMPLQNADPETTWAYLEEGIDRIMAEPGQMQYARYMSLYTIAYTLCTTSRAQDTGEQESDQRSESEIYISLYDNVTRCFATHVRGLNGHSDSLQDEALLRYYTQEWDRYKKGAQDVNRLLPILNRVWVRKKQKEGRKDIYTVDMLAIVQWKQNYFFPDSHRLKGALLRLIERQQQDESIDRTLIQEVIDAFLSLCLKDVDNKKAHNVCLHNLEALFLEAARKYNDGDSEASSIETSTPDLLKKVEEWLQRKGRV